MREQDQNIHIVINYYHDFNEQERLSDAWGQIEFVRTMDILSRYLPDSPASILDVGGATGKYACWLARQGYDVSLIDPVPLHIEQAREASARQPDHPIAQCLVGDARHLEFQDECADAVLLMGPLYHLIDINDRILALQEARRVLKPNGRLFAVGISRFASTIDGFDSGFFHDPMFQDIMRQDLQDGQHRNPTNNPRYFTDTFFHHPEELKHEVQLAGFTLQAMVAIEGIGYVMKDFDTNWENEASREFLLEILRTIEQEPTLIGASPHIMGVAVKS
jgi:ubiquinone/menaquinone biosynthesis C-methylase UbiE